MDSMDKINIKNLEIFARHGVFAEEKALEQKFVISVSLFSDLRVAGRSDNLKASIDYGKICREIKEYAEGNSFNLIETLAEGLSWKLLEDEPLLRKVWIEIKKPWAAVGANLETVSVEIERGWHTAYIALGSNMGDKKSFLDNAIVEIDRAQGCRAICVSKYYETAPFGYTEQDDFLNGCLLIETLLSPAELLGLLHAIENTSGRVREIKWGPRTLDLDIIFYDDFVITDDALMIPHAEMHKRDFVLNPLSDIAPNMMHPILRKTVSELLNELKNDCN